MPTSRSNNLIAITVGDPGGIGPEIIVKALASPALRAYLRSPRRPISFLVIGPRLIYERARRRFAPTLTLRPLVEPLPRLPRAGVYLLDVGRNAANVTIGKRSHVNAAISVDALACGTRLVGAGEVNALVTGPINKEAVAALMPGFVGHTEYLAQAAGGVSVAMMLTGGPFDSAHGKPLRVVLVTTHIPLAKVSRAITVPAILGKIALTDHFLRVRMGLRRPRIAVAALNPHAGEGGTMGTEEREVIAPALTRAKRHGINVVGPVPADTLFHHAVSGAYDAVVCMYHDQGLGPLKMHALHTGVNVTLGLPFVRTSPDHGTAFDIAGKGIAHPGSMIEAIKMAVALVR